MNMPMPPPPFEVPLAYSTTVSLDVTAPNPTLEESGQDEGIRFLGIV